MPRFSRFALAGGFVGSLTWKANAIRTLISDAAELTAVDEWGVYDSKGGPVYTDVAQGSLGDCYYLAGLAALAHTHPETIKQAFVTTGEINSLGRSIYQLRFMVDGEVKMVAIDDSIPMFEKKRYKSRFYFARMSQSEEVWPALLEKGFAKLFGSYFAIRGGWAFQAFKAITQAPVDMLHEKPANDMWDFIQEAVANNWPVAGGTTSNDFGTAAGHAFVILSTGTKEGKQAVHVYNPWGTKNNYAGELKHLSTRDVGNYWLTLDEFGKAFNLVTRARVLPHAHLSSISIPVGSAVAVQFTTKLTRSRSHENPDFYVQLEWPDEKIMPEGCQVRISESSISMRVGLKSAGPSAAVDAKRPVLWNEISNLRATVPANAGTYVAMIGSHFEDMPSIKKLVMNVYAEEAVKIEVVDVESTIKSLYGLCNDLKWRNFHLKRAADFRGSPAWDSVEADPSKASSPAVLWFARKGLQVSSSRAKHNSVYTGFQESDLKCLDSTEMHQFDNCDSVTWKKYYKLTKDGEFAGVPKFSTSKGFMLYFAGGEWTVTKPGLFTGHYQKGTDQLNCNKGGSLAEASEGDSAGEETVVGLSELDVEERETEGEGEGEGDFGTEIADWTAEKESNEGPESPEKVNELMSRFGKCEWLAFCTTRVGKRIHDDPRQPAVWQMRENYLANRPSLFYIRKDGEFSSIIGTEMHGHKNYNSTRYVQFKEQYMTCADKIAYSYNDCSSIQWNGITFAPSGHYPEETELVRYKSDSSSKEALEIRFTTGTWAVVKADHFDWPTIPYPKIYDSLKKNQKQMKCVKSSLAEVEAEVEELQLIYNEVEEHVQEIVDEHQHANSTSTGCNQDLLAKNLKRYSNLNNFEALKTGKDKLFPEELASIGDPEKDCGDSATGEKKDCKELNNWRSITEKYGKPDVTPKSALISF